MAPPGPALELLAAQLPGEHHLLYTEVDGNFPNHHPDPTVEANLEDLKRLVAEKNLDFGMAFDGDGDRIGAIDGAGPRDLGRSAADDLCRGPAGAGAGRHDYRRCEGQPRAVRARSRNAAASR